MKHGEKSKQILNELDLFILKIIIASDNKKEKISIGEMEKKLEINSLSLRKHLNKLIKMGLIKKEKVPKTNKYLLTPIDKNIGFFKYLELLWKGITIDEEAKKYKK